ncbi:MAG: alpha-ketoacid dehydrogenase subunit beta [Planctomycetes bacterium]|nr:alpha-ketoacid dehydrogenase subunit beta [Planctomycetota bacterium]
MPWTTIAIDKSGADTDSLRTGEGERVITYREAIKEALTQAMERDPAVFVMGQGVDDPGGVFGTTSGLPERFGDRRVFDTPIAENGITGVSIGAALAGMRPVLVHMRVDFLPMSMDQLVNHAAKWRYMFGGKVSVPLTIRCIVGRGWGSAAQHSQSLQALFVHVPGLKVVMPSSPYDAKGLLLASIADRDPVIFIEHRWLFDHVGHVPEHDYIVPLGKGTVIRQGKDVTVVGISHMAFEARKAAEELEKEGVDAEVLDLRCLSPLDKDLLFDSVKKTGRLVVADTGWKTCGVGAEIAALASEEVFDYLKAPIKRIATADTPTPSSHPLEEAFYPGSADIVSAVKELLS